MHGATRPGEPPQGLGAARGVARISPHRLSGLRFVTRQLCGRAQFAGVGEPIGNGRNVKLGRPVHNRPRAWPWRLPQPRRAAPEGGTAGALLVEAAYAEYRLAQAARGVGI